MNELLKLGSKEIGPSQNPLFQFLDDLLIRYFAVHVGLASGDPSDRISAFKTKQKNARLKSALSDIVRKNPYGFQGTIKYFNGKVRKESLDWNKWIHEVYMHDGQKIPFSIMFSSAFEDDEYLDDAMRQGNDNGKIKIDFDQGYFFDSRAATPIYLPKGIENVIFNKGNSDNKSQLPVKQAKNLRLSRNRTYKDIVYLKAGDINDRNSFSVSVDTEKNKARLVSINLYLNLLDYTQRGQVFADNI